MQENVNAVKVHNYAINNFGSGYVHVLPDGVIKISTNALANGDILSISNMLQWANAYVKRSDKGLIILLNPKPDASPMDIIHYCDDSEVVTNSPLPKVYMVRDFYENLPQDVRIKAFDNTSKNKWDMYVSSLEEALLRSFYINHSPEGAEYWQDIILQYGTKN